MFGVKHPRRTSRARLHAHGSRPDEREHLVPDLESIVTRIPTALRWAAPILWMAVLFGFSSLPGSSVPGRFASLGHLMMYTILGMLLWIALYQPGRTGNALAIAIIIASLYGISDEFHQSFVPGRTPDVVDWGVDTLGALLGASLAFVVVRKRGA